MPSAYMDYLITCTEVSTVFIFLISKVKKVKHREVRLFCLKSYTGRNKVKSRLSGSRVQACRGAKRLSGLSNSWGHDMQ